MRLKLSFTLLLALACPVFAQSPVDTAGARRVNEAMGSTESGSAPLPCSLEPMKAFLDFGFRFQSGYVLRCPFNAFGTGGETIGTFVRIRPEGGSPVLLGENYQTPKVAPEVLARINMAHFKEELEVSGGFALGEGEYAADFIAVDQRNRIFRKHWQIRARLGHAERAVPVSLKPGTVEPFYRHPPEELGSNRSGVRLTILLDAAPMDPRSQRLRVWDRALLLDCISSLIRHTPTESIRLVAFNLDQQREIFRQDSFDKAGFEKLAGSLRDLELGTVSYRTLENGLGWSDLLTRLVTEESRAARRPDAVIFLGPTAKIDGKLPEAGVKLPGTAAIPPLFYLEYVPYWRMGREFPDVLARMVTTLDGKVFKVHSPHELEKAIQQMQGSLKMGDDSKAEMHDGQRGMTSP